MSDAAQHGRRPRDSNLMAERNLTAGQRISRVALAMLTALVLAFLVAPILIIVPLSFSSGSFFYYPLPGFSLRWYEDFFTSSFWLPSVWNSLIVGTSRNCAGDDARNAGGARILARTISRAGAAARAADLADGRPGDHRRGRRLFRIRAAWA